MNSQGRRVKAQATDAAKLPVEEGLGQMSIEVGRAGEWMPAEELREAAMTALAEAKDITLNLVGLTHLDASALQILLALDAEHRQRGLHLNLVSVSPELKQWFEYSGTADHFVHDGEERP